MIVNREKLLKAIEILSLVPSRPGITSSEFIKIVKKSSGIKMSLASEVLGVATCEVSGNSWPVESPFFVDKRLITPFLLAGANGKKIFEFSAKEDKKKQKVLHIKHGRRSADFAPLPKVGGYSDIEIPKGTRPLKFTESQEVLIQCALNWSTPDPVTPQLNCVFVTSKGLVLSYNQLAIFAGKTDTFKDSIPLPLYLLALITDPKRRPRILLSKKQVILEYESGTIAQSLPQKAVEEFPVKDIMSSMKAAAKLPEQFSIPSDRFFKVLERFSSYIAEVRKKDRVIRLERETENSLSIETKLQHVSMKEVIKVTGTVGKVKCDWALDLVLPIVKHLAMEKTDIKVRYDDKKKTPYYLTANDVTLAIARKA